MADERSTGTEVSTLIEKELAGFLATPASVQAARAPDLPVDIIARLNAVLNSKQGRSYRDATIIQFGYGVVGAVVSI